MPPTVALIIEPPPQTEPAPAPVARLRPDDAGGRADRSAAVGASLPPQPAAGAGFVRPAV
jgi:hypothetical protein